MLEKSTQTIDTFITRLEQRMKENEQVLQTREVRSKETITRNQKLIDDSKTPPIERLRALIMNVIESDDILQLHREQASLLQSTLLATIVRMFQEEVACELNLLNAKSLLQTPKSEETEKYGKIEKRLRKIKSTMDNDWKPLMNKLQAIIDERERFLDKNR